MITARRHARLLTYLDGSGHSASEVGERAARLDRIIGCGYPVPHAAVITGAAYLEAIQENSLSLLVRDLRSSAVPSPDRARAEAAAIDRAFLNAPVDATLQRAIQRVADELLPEGPLIVRSSPITPQPDDAEGIEFEGTCVGDAAALEQAVRRCWASQWMPTERRRRREKHTDTYPVAIAVVVQPSVHGRTIGRAFSTDPGGRAHLIRIETGPSWFLLRKDNLETTLGEGEQPEYLEDIARLVLSLERALGAPQEVTWASDDEGIVLLDALPISVPVARSTFDDGFDGPWSAADVYTPHGVIEMLPGVVPPLLWTINAPMLENAFRAAFADLGGSTPDSTCNMVARIRGRAALNLSAICRVAESLPGGNPAEVERQYLGRNIAVDDSPRSSGVHLFAALRSRHVHRRIADDVQLIDTAARSIADLEVDVAHLPVRRLVAYRQRIRDLAWRGYAAEVGASSAAGATYRALELLLERWLTEPVAAEWAQRLTRTAIDRSTLGGLRSIDLANVLLSYGTAEIREVLATEPEDPADAIRKIGPAGERFLRHLDTAAHAMGSKAVYGDATWAEDRRWVWRQLHLLNAVRRDPKALLPDPDRDLDELIVTLSRDRKWRRLRILTGQFIDLRARWLRRQVDETTSFLELREQAKNALLILGGEERRIIVEAAGRLMVSRQLPAPELVEYLTDAELDGMLFGSCAVSTDELERRRTVAMRCREASPLPDWFVGDPGSSSTTGAAVSTRLEGWGTSPGQMTGTARVITSLQDGARLSKGEVLVAHSTDPSWTPLFLTAGAVVLETGGPLSHASIVAREFGLPAVLNVQEATRIITDGETVAVDGSTGVVTRLGGGES